MALKKSKSTKTKAEPAAKKATGKKKTTSAPKPAVASATTKTAANNNTTAKTRTARKVPAKTKAPVADTKEQAISAATTNVAETGKATSKETLLSFSAKISTPEETAMATPSKQPATVAAGSNVESESNREIFTQPDNPFTFGNEKVPAASPQREVAIDPLPPPKNIVIADFFLPGCCTFDDDCNPMCSSPEEMLALAIPPVAKSDFITTSANMAVNIRVMINDDPVTGDTLEIVPNGFTPFSEQGGTVVLSADGTYFTYTPPAGNTAAFTGFDKFFYSVRNKVNKLSDTATVYINVMEGVSGQTIEPTITVTSEFCAADKRNAQMIPISISKGTYTDPSYVFTIKNESAKPWLVKLGDVNYAIDTSKITGNLSYVLELQRNGVTVDTTNFTVHLVIADLDYTTIMNGISGGGGNGDIEFISEPDLSFRALSFDGNKLYSRIIIPDFTLYTLTLYNYCSSQATNFTWQLINNAGNVVNTQMTTSRSPITIQNIYESWLTLGYKIRLTASSPIGCTDTIEVPLTNKPFQSR
jgi:hypothetical protein